MAMRGVSSCAQFYVWYDFVRFLYERSGDPIPMTPHVFPGAETFSHCVSVCADSIAALPDYEDVLCVAANDNDRRRFRALAAAVRDGNAQQWLAEDDNTGMTECPCVGEGKQHCADIGTNLRVCASHAAFHRLLHQFSERNLVYGKVVANACAPHVTAIMADTFNKPLQFFAMSAKHNAEMEKFAADVVAKLTSPPYVNDLLQRIGAASTASHQRAAWAATSWPSRSKPLGAGGAAPTYTKAQKLMQTKPGRQRPAAPPRGASRHSLRALRAVFGDADDGDDTYGDSDSSSAIGGNVPPPPPVPGGGRATRVSEAESPTQTSIGDRIRRARRSEAMPHPLDRKVAALPVGRRTRGAPNVDPRVLQAPEAKEERPVGAVAAAAARAAPVSAAAESVFAAETASVAGTASVAAGADTGTPPVSASASAAASTVAERAEPQEAAAFTGRVLRSLHVPAPATRALRSSEKPASAALATRKRSFDALSTASAAPSTATTGGASSEPANVPRPEGVILQLSAPLVDMPPKASGAKLGEGVIANGGSSDGGDKGSGDDNTGSGDDNTGSGDEEGDGGDGDDFDDPFSSLGLTFVVQQPLTERRRSLRSGGSAM